MIKNNKASEFTTPNQRIYPHFLFIQLTSNQAYACSIFFHKINLLKHSMNPSIIQITTNTQLKPNYPMYLFNLRITIDIQFKLNDSMYPSDETNQISKV